MVLTSESLTTYNHSWALFYAKRFSRSLEILVEYDICFSIPLDEKLCPPYSTLGADCLLELTKNLLGQAQTPVWRSDSTPFCR